MIVDPAVELHQFATISVRTFFKFLLLTKWENLPCISINTLQIFVRNKS